ncbi:MAG: hypothetical protein ACREE9_23145 [Stellaceae bacterium]
MASIRYVAILKGHQRLPDCLRSDRSALGDRSAVGSGAKVSAMRIRSIKGSVEDLRRKLRAVAAVADDSAATEHEKTNARALKARLQHRLREAGSPAGDWTDNVFRLARWATGMRKSISPASPKGDWTDNAHRLGKALRRGSKKWLSD